MQRHGLPKAGLSQPRVYYMSFTSLRGRVFQDKLQSDTALHCMHAPWSKTIQEPLTSSLIRSRPMAHEVPAVIATIRGTLRPCGPPVKTSVRPSESFKKQQCGTHSPAWTFVTKLLSEKLLAGLNFPARGATKTSKKHFYRLCLSQEKCAYRKGTLA